VTVIRSARKTLALELRGGEVLVRAPRRVSEKEIQAFLDKHQGWIEKNRARQIPAGPRLTPEELRALAERAAAHIPERVRYYAPRVGVTYGRITIRSQRTRWGSCTAKGNLNFNCLLMLAPPEVLDSVVVHELCHRKEPNHSQRFYAEVLRVLPDYRERHRWLREHGEGLILRLPHACSGKN